MPKLILFNKVKLKILSILHVKSDEISWCDKREEYRSGIINWLNCTPSMLVLDT